MRRGRRIARLVGLIHHCSSGRSNHICNVVGFEGAPRRNVDQRDGTCGPRVGRGPRDRSCRYSPLCFGRIQREDCLVSRRRTIRPHRRTGNGPCVPKGWEHRGSAFILRATGDIPRAGRGVERLGRGIVRWKGRTRCVSDGDRKAKPPAPVRHQAAGNHPFTHGFASVVGITTIFWRLPQTTRAVVDQPSVPSSPSSAAWIGTLASGEPPEVRSPDGPPVQVTV